MSRIVATPLAALRRLRCFPWRAAATAALALGMLLPSASMAQPAASGAAAPDDHWAVPVTWWVAARTTGYWYEALDPDTNEQSQRFNFYQTYDGSVTQLAGGHLDFRLAGRYADADLFPLVETNEHRLHVGYAQARFAPWRTRGRLGRMFLQEGPASHTFDGIHVSVEPIRRVELRLWGGLQAPPDLDWEVEKLDDRAAYGGRILGSVSPKLRLGFSAAQWDEGGEPAARPLGLEVTWFPLRGLRTFTRGEYEMKGEFWRRVEILGDYVPRRGSPWQFRAQFLDRAPRIDNTSYFARFDVLERIRAVRASARYQMENGLGAEVESYTGIIDSRTSARLGGALLFRYGRLGYSALFGDSGEKSQWYGDVYAPVTTWAKVNAGAVIATYALFQDAPENEERDLVTLFARATVDVLHGVRCLVEVQGLKNPDFDEDVRLLLGLDLLAGRGASNFGIGRGGWTPW